MTREIEIDDEVFAYLQKYAKAFVDEPNDVLRRLLFSGSEVDSPPAHATAYVSTRTEGHAGPTRNNPRRSKKSSQRNGDKPSRSRAPSDSLLPEAEYVLPILCVLERAGGRAPASEVIAKVGDVVRERLMPLDLEDMNNGRQRWEMRTQFARLRMVKQGLLAADAPRGVWAISDEGRLALNKEEAVLA